MDFFSQMGATTPKATEAAVGFTIADDSSASSDFHEANHLLVHFACHELRAAGNSSFTSRLDEGPALHSKTGVRSRDLSDLTQKWGYTDIEY